MTAKQIRIPDPDNITDISKLLTLKDKQGYLKHRVYTTTKIDIVFWSSCSQLFACNDNYANSTNQNINYHDSLLSI